MLKRLLAIFVNNNYCDKKTIKSKAKIIWKCLKEFLCLRHIVQREISEHVDFRLCTVFTLQIFFFSTYATQKKAVVYNAYFLSSDTFVALLVTFLCKDTVQIPFFMLITLNFLLRQTLDSIILGVSEI